MINNTNTMDIRKLYSLFVKAKKKVKTLEIKPRIKKRR